MIQKQQENEKKRADHSDIFFRRSLSLLFLGRAFLLLMRFDRPVGIFIPLFAAFLGLFGGAFPSFPKTCDIIFFSLGAFVMRGAACILNDIWDREFDAKVKRTRLRPLASKSISLHSAFIFLSFLLGCGFLILIQFTYETILLGVLLVLLSVVYPLMKRITYWPQLFLGITFNGGVLMGWVSQGRGLDLTCFILYGATILWTIGYDTIYAYQDIEDDLLIGVKSSAIKMKNHAKLFLMSVYVGSIYLFYWFGERMILNFFYKGACFLVGIHFLSQVIGLNIRNPSNCLKKFKSNVWVGFILFFGLVLSSLLR